MKKLVLCAAALMLSFSAFAEIKIAVVDTQQALVESEEAKSLLEKHRQELEKEESEVRAMADQLRAGQERLQKDAEVMSAADRRAQQKSLEDLQIDYQFRVNKLQKEITDRQNEILQQLLPKVNAVLKDLIELEGYDVIMERSSLRYANPKHDITRRVTEKLNDRK
ncbi:MAG: OmpH family outer membrane protein [Pseudomonadaceae bacterium]|nr:OmpH family outer membrane protein [Pseudomonadaceae bacterium]